MGFPKDPRKYPSEFAGLYRRALKEDFEVDMGDRNLAINYIHRLHAYRRAVEAERNADYSSLRSIIIKNRGTRVVFGNDLQAMAAIRAAVGMVVPTDTELDDYLATLEQGMDGDDRPIRDTDSREQPIYSDQEKAEGQVETDYLKLFPAKEDKPDEDSTGSG